MVGIVSMPSNCFLLPLECSLSEAIALYGEPVELHAAEQSPEISAHTFQIGKYHQAIAMVWQDRVRSVTYWSAKSDPSRDLACMLEHYTGESRWSVLEKGYWYQRDDGKLKLWCSAAPVVGVADVEFLSVKADLQIANDVKKLVELEDPTWVANNAIFDLQRRFVSAQDTALLEFAARSNRIAVSEDGRDVLIVRDHQAHDVDDGYVEYNCPPELGEGVSTQVINFFRWSADSSVWTKAALPRDADVESINFHRDTCHVKIRRTTDGRLVSLTGPLSLIQSLGAMSLDRPLQDEKLWAALETAQARGSVQ